MAACTPAQPARPGWPQAVEFAARTAATCHTISSGIVELMDLGIAEPRAARLMFVVPHAFGSVVYGREGIVFAPAFRDGERLCRFADEPAWLPALALAARWLETAERALVAAACDWSEQVAITRVRQQQGQPLEAALREPPRFVCRTS